MTPVHPVTPDMKYCTKGIAQDLAGILGRAEGHLDSKFSRAKAPCTSGRRRKARLRDASGVLREIGGKPEFLLEIGRNSGGIGAPMRSA